MKIIKNNNGRYMYRCSRWIRIQTNYNPGKNNSLWEYVRDGYGRGPWDSDFNTGAGSGLYLDFFRWDGKTWAIEQFLRMDYPATWEENGKLQYLSGYDCNDYYNPIMIEISDGGEYVRVYRELTELETDLYNGGCL